MIRCIKETKHDILITVEDHFVHGGMGDFAMAALNAVKQRAQVHKMAVHQISRSGKMEELLELAGIDAGSIVSKVHALLPAAAFH